MQNYGISIHAPREGSDQHPLDKRQRGRISIHAPREGSDGQYPGHAAAGDISIHAPREGSDLQAATQKYPAPDFNPRSP